MRTVWLLALAVSVGAAQAQQRAVIIYRCTDEAGRVLVQNDRPCPKGMQERKRVFEAPSSPTPTVSGSGASAATGPEAAREPARRPGGGASPSAAAGSRTGGATAADTGGPPGTSPGTARGAATPGTTTPAPTATPPTGGASLPAPPPLFECRGRDHARYFSPTAQPAPRCIALATTGLDGRPETAAGTACETVQDTCAPVPEAGLCEAWRGHMAELERQTREADANRRPIAQDELEAAVARYDASTCGTPAGVIPAP